MLNIRTQIRTYLNPSKQIRFRIRSKNIRTVFIPSLNSTQLEEYNVHSMSASIIVLSLQYICALATTNKEEAEGINHCMCFTFMLFDRYVRKSTNWYLNLPNIN